MSGVPLAFAGRVAVVTGSNKGIGFFIALQLGMSGLFQNVLLACRDEARGCEAASTMQQTVGDRAVIKYTPLTLGEHQSHIDLKNRIEQEYGKLDVLVNNAAMAFKGTDPTPFHEQTKPTLDVNYRGTVHLAEQLLPLLKKGDDPRVVNVASMSGSLRKITSDELRARFRSSSLTIEELNGLVDSFERDVRNGTHRSMGWGNSNYGMSKLALIAATKVLARENPDVIINCCCPGSCKTDMSSQRGTRQPSEGAKNAVLPATMDDPPTGQYFADFQVSQW